MSALPFIAQKGLYIDENRHTLWEIAYIVVVDDYYIIVPVPILAGYR